MLSGGARKLVWRVVACEFVVGGVKARTLWPVPVRLGERERERETNSEPVEVW
jgi:hypothetical protein